MVGTMVLELLFGFLVLVAASYVGTTMALRGFFGRERYDPSDGRGGGASESDTPSPSDGVPRAGDFASDDSGNDE
jgi:hypothetical protein